MYCINKFWYFEKILINYTENILSKDILQEVYAQYLKKFITHINIYILLKLFQKSNFKIKLFQNSTKLSLIIFFAHCNIIFILNHDFNLKVNVKL